LDRLAAATNGVPAPVKFWRDQDARQSLRFSFSGLRPRLLYHVQEHPATIGRNSQQGSGTVRGERKYEQLLPCAAGKRLRWYGEFQNAVVRDLVARTLVVRKKYPRKAF